MPVSSQTLTTLGEQPIYYQWTLGGDSQHCINQWFAFSADPGDTVTGTITASQQAMVVYLLSDQQNTAWGNQHNCDPRNSGIGVQRAWGSNSAQISSAQVNWTPSVSDRYWFVVETFSGNPVTVTVNLSAQVSVTTTAIAYFTQYSSGIQYNTQTFTSAVVQAIPLIPDWISYLIVAIMVVVIFALILFFTRRGNKPKVETIIPDTTAQVAQMPAKTKAKPFELAKTVMYCSQCGAVIPRDSKFCKECGTKF